MMEKKTIGNLMFSSHRCSMCQGEHYFITGLNPWGATIILMRFNNIELMKQFCRAMSDFVQEVQESLDIPEPFKKAFDNE